MDNKHNFVSYFKMAPPALDFPVWLESGFYREDCIVPRPPKNRRYPQVGDGLKVQLDFKFPLLCMDWEAEKKAGGSGGYIPDVDGFPTGSTD